jgi:magnesium transporter
MSSSQEGGPSSGWFSRSLTSPTEEDSILPSHTPPGQRRSIDSTHSIDLASSPTSFGNRNTSPIQARSPESDEARERQRTMDVESAMLLSRARSNTILQSHPAQSPLFEQDKELIDRYPMLSRREEEEIALARGEHKPATPEVGFNYVVPEATIPTPEVGSTHHLDALAHDEKQYTKLPVYSQPSYRDHVDFSAMEEFAKEERVKLNLTLPSGILGMDEFRRRLLQKQRSTQLNVPSQENCLLCTDVDVSDQFNRTRQRKLSQSQPKPRTRSRKLALFENAQASVSRSINAGPSVTFDSDTPRVHPGPQDPNADRPFRFSFYSNSLSSTIHSQSICELPAEGQTFEQLFHGTNNNASEDSNGLASDHPKSTHSQSRTAFTSDDINTWWLDVLNPTDEEMRVFAKVISTRFIHQC